MKKTTAAVVISVCTVVLIITGAFTAVPAVNDRAAEKLADLLSSLPPPEGAAVLESVCAAGKLTGNGNGILYFAAILVSSELTTEELADYYRQKTGKSSVFADEQTENAISVADRATLSFSSKLDENGSYRIVYLWDGSTSFYRNLDIRAH